MHMPFLAATAAAAILLVASPGAGSGTDAARLAAKGGFLLGNAHRCGIPTDRVVRTGQLIRELIIAVAEDAHEQESATERFAKVFMATAAPDKPDSKLIASCAVVSSEFEKLEGHVVTAEAAKPGAGEKRAAGNTGRPNFRLGDGE
jgi:hypothetical protein